MNAGFADSEIVMRKKSNAFSFQLGERVWVPGLKGVQGVVSLPWNRTDGEVAIITLAKPVKVAAKRKLPAATPPDETEGRIVFVAWTGDDGIRLRAHFTEVALIAAQLMVTTRLSE